MATNKNKMYLIIGGVLVLLLIGVTALLISEKKVNHELTQEFELEKEDLEPRNLNWKRRTWKTSTPPLPNNMMN